MTKFEPFAQQGVRHRKSDITTSEKDRLKKYLNDINTRVAGFPISDGQYRQIRLIIGEMKREIDNT